MTYDLERTEVATADNVVMLVCATVNWRIEDVELVARAAVEMMSGGADIAKLRNDVLKQVSASLAVFIGMVNYSDTFSAAAAVQQTRQLSNMFGLADVAPPPGPGPSAPYESLMFDTARMSSCIGHANDVTRAYGVRIISINIMKAKPADPQLMAQLARGAVAAAEAQQLETTATGRARAARIDAEGQGEAAVARARAEAQAGRIAADGAAEVSRIRADADAAVMLTAA